jgi:dTDP-4-dehydrorhamnose 3,5-epimerase-like enzyme
MEFYRILTFRELGDERGNLVAIEGSQDIPFDIKRVFYLYGSDPGVARGMHANRESDFVLINVGGSSKVKVNDGMGHEEVICLDKPKTGIYIPKMIWKEMYDFSSDSIILVLTNTHYNNAEYIRDFGEFEKEVARQLAESGR